LDEQQMATFIGTIGMYVARRTALVAGDDIVGDAFAETVVKNEVLADEFALQTFGFHLARIL
jgi:hypothetical protein